MPYGPALQAWKRHCGAGAIFRERAWEESSGKWSKNIQHGYMTIKWPLYDHLPQSKSSGKCLPRYFTSFLGYFYEYPVTVVSPGVETKPNALPEMFIFGRTALQSCHILARINGRWKILANKNQRNIGNSCCCNSCILNPGLIIKSGLITQPLRRTWWTDPVLRSSDKELRNLGLGDPVPRKSDQVRFDSVHQRPSQESKLEVLTIYKAYIRPM